jgi:hypothetical protein
MPKYETWVVLERLPGDLNIEILRGLLEAQGVPVYLAQEGAARAIGLTAGPLATVEVMVPAEHADDARRILEDYRMGRLETDEELDDGSTEPIDT